jgi:predicted permease
VIGPVRPALWALFAGVCILLLIACANVSALMLTRASLREPELAVRLALGATRARIARDWMLETLVLAASGGALGLAASRWMVDAIVALAPADVPGLGEIAIDGTAAGFSVMAVVAAALLCGAASVRHASAARLLGVLHGGTRSTPERTTHRARSLMLVVQIALSVVLLVAAGLVVRSFANLRQIDLGFSPARVLTMRLEPRDPNPSANAWMGDLVARVSAMRGVESAGAVFLRPLALGAIGQETTVVLDGQPATPEAARLNPLLNYEVATRGYFATMRITLKRGRLFDARDSAGAPRVAIVSESTARRLWPGDDPIGRRLLMPTFVTGKPGNAWRTVVGVVGDVRYRGIDDLRLDVYDAAMQSTTGALDLVVRTSGDPRSVAGAIQAEARRLDSHVVIDRMSTMEAVVAQTVAPWRFAMWTFTVFSALAVALAMVGLFSVVSLDVAQRRRELAIRVALGAQRHDVLRPVLGPAAARVAIGVAIGTGVATAGAHAIRSLLFGVGTLDPSTYAVAIGLMAATVAVASYVPARRAAGVDPIDALRAE